MGPSSLRSSTLALALTVALALPACGARTLLDLGGDAGVVEDRDGGTPPRDGGPPTGAVRVRCPGAITTRPGVPVPLAPTVESDRPLARVAWTIPIRPPRSTTARFDDPNAERTNFTADIAGDYVLEFTAFDVDGRSSSCQTNLRAATSAPVAVCPEPFYEVRVDTDLMVFAEGYDEEGPVTFEWDVIAAPSESSPLLFPLDAPVATFRADVPGRYRLRFRVFDFEGMSASCEVEVVVTGPMPPLLSCPATIDTTPLTSTLIAVPTSDDGFVVDSSWRVEGRPPGSTARPPMVRPGTSIDSDFVPDLAGEYRIVLTVVDDEGLRSSCTTVVRARNVDGLRVEMFWDTSGTDMDLHLLNPDAPAWFNDDDCYWTNCDTGSSGGVPILGWGDPGTTDDDPRLDIDDVDGLGPENINILRPAPGTYRIGVHAFRTQRLFNSVTVRVYCGGSDTVPTQTFGPTILRIQFGGADSPDTNDFWRVADVDIGPRGDCRIRPLMGADGRADIILGQREASTTR